MDSKVKGRVEVKVYAKPGELAPPEQVSTPSNLLARARDILRLLVDTDERENGTRRVHWIVIDEATKVLTKEDATEDEIFEAFTEVALSLNDYVPPFHKFEPRVGNVENDNERAGWRIWGFWPDYDALESAVDKGEVIELKNVMDSRPQYVYIRDEMGAKVALFSLHKEWEVE